MSHLSPVSDFNLEFAHVALEGGRRFDESEIKKSAEIALKELSTIEAQGAVCAVCILIDDKHVNARLTYRDMAGFRDAVISCFPRVDYIFFEKNLPKFKEQIFPNIRENMRDKVEASLWRYQKAHRRLGCSHDIAIWHMMRLGLINEIDAAMMPSVGWGQSRSPVPPFVARNVVSILSEKDQPFEKRAMDDILRFCTDTAAIRKIRTIYYD
jgi:hypothetical protein